MPTRPLRFSEIDLPFLQSCLASSNLPAEKLAGFELSEVPEPGQTASMCFINLTYDGDASNLPHRLVAKQRTDHQVTFDYMEELGGTQREVAFYNHIHSRCQLKIPTGFYGAYEEGTGEFLLIMEDCSGPPLGDWVTASVPQAEILLQSLKNMHAHWWNNQEIENAAWSAGFSSEPGCFMHKMQETFQRVAQAFTEIFRDEIDDHYVALVLAALGKPEIINAFDATSKTLVHGDYHYKNAFFPAGEPPVILDWQCVGYGTPAIDIGRVFLFLNGSDVDRKTDAMLLAYHTELVNAGVSNYSFDQLQHDMAIGFIYNTWLTINALMETDIHIIRDVIAAKGGTLEQVCGEMSARTKHSGCLEFISAW